MNRAQGGSVFSPVTACLALPAATAVLTIAGSGLLGVAMASALGSSVAIAAGLVTRQLLLRRTEAPLSAPLTQTCPEQGTDQITQLLALFNTVATISNGASTVNQAVANCLEAVCVHTGWPVAHAYRPTLDGELVSARQWYVSPDLDPDQISAFRSMSEETRFREGVGMVGKVAQTAQPVVLKDVTKAQGFLRAEAAARNGVRGCFAVPVISGKQVVLVLEFFSREEAVMDDRTVRLMTYVGGQLARVVERRDNDRKLKLMADTLESEIKSVADSVCAAADEMASAAAELAQTAEQASTRSGQASRGSSQIIDAVHQVANATQAYERASNEISEWVGKTDRIASTANQSAHETGSAVADLQGAVDHVDGVIEVISAIARSISILALNATIEAKRAGEAGRGFEVVANEVRSLANQTATATVEVRHIVQQIKGVSHQTRDTLDQIGSVMTDMAAASDGIRTSLQKQAQVTSAVSGRIREAGRDSSEIADSIRHLDDSTKQSRTAASQLLQSATSLSQQGQNLAVSVETFLEGVQALRQRSA